MRRFGSGAPVIVLLHGMLASGDVFGADFYRIGFLGTVLVPDLLGFGGSAGLDVVPAAADHLDALDEVLHALAPDGRLLIVIGHSMGGTVALRWAARHPERVAAVVTFCASLNRDRTEADAGVQRMGAFATLLGGDGRLPRAVCAWMCRFRTTASWLAVILRPDLPVAVARSAVQHTWAAYNGALNTLIRSSDWEPTLSLLAAAAVPVTLVEAAHDPVPVAGRAAHVAAENPNRTCALHPSAGHDLPLVDSEWCAALIAAVCPPDTTM